MTDYLKGLWARVTVRWHVVLAAFIAALPSILDYLGLIDLKPLLLGLGLKESIVNFIVGIMPFVLMFLKPMFAVAPVEPEAE